MNKEDRPKGMSQLDWLWQNLGDYTISNNPSDDSQTIITSDVVNKLIKDATDKNLVNLTFRDDPSDPTQVEIIGTTVDGSTVSIFMPKEVYVNAFKLREITQTDVDNGVEFSVGTRVLSITLTNGTEYLVSVDEFDKNTQYNVSDSNTIDMYLGDDNIIRSDLKIDTGNNHFSLIQLHTTESGIYADIRLSTEDNGVEIYNHQSGLSARIPIKGSDKYLYFEDVTLAKYMSLDAPIEGHLYIIRDKSYIFYNGRKYGVDINSEDSPIISAEYDPETTTITLEFADNREPITLVLGTVSEESNGLMTPEMLDILNTTKEDLDILEEKFEKRNSIFCNLINKYSGKPIGIRNHVQGPAVVEQQELGNYLDQQWEIVKCTEGYYKIQQANYELGTTPRYSATGINSVISTDFINDSSSQKWNIIPYSIDNVTYYRIINLHSNLTLAVEYDNTTSNPSIQPGAAIRQVEWTGGAEQLWSFNEIQQTPNQVIYWNLNDTLRCLGIDSGFQLADAALVKTADYTDNTIENNSCVWTLEYNEDGSFKLKNTQSGFYACTYQDSTTQGTALIQTSNREGLGTNFTYSDNYITELSSGLVLGIEGGNTALNTNIIIWPKQEEDVAQICYMTPYYGQSTSNVTINQGTYIPNEMLGKANGVATLNENGKIPSSQLDGHIARVQGIDEVVVTELPTESLVEGWMVWVTSTKLFNEWNGTEWEVINPVEDTIYNFRNSDATGDTSRTNILYRWDGQDLTEISESLALGEVEGTAYDGAKGKENREAIESLTAKVEALENANYDESISELTESINELNSTVVKQVKVGSNAALSPVDGLVAIPNATTASDGSLSKEDKSKLDKVIITGDGNQYLSNDGTYKEVSMNLSDSYTASDLVNQDLEPKAGDSYETAISKLHKANLDNEDVIASAFVAVKQTVGLTDDVKLPDLSKSNYISEITNITEGLTTLDNVIKTNSDNISTQIQEVSNNIPKWIVIE